MNPYPDEYIMADQQIQKEEQNQIHQNQALDYRSKVVLSEFLKCLKRAEDLTSQANYQIELVRSTLEDPRIQVKFLHEK